MSQYKREVYIIESSDLMEMYEDFIVEFCQPYSNGCYVPLSKSWLLYEKRQDIIDDISKMIGTSDWTDVLIDWSW